MELLIFKKSGALLKIVKPDETSELVQIKQNEDYVRLIFKTESPIDFSIGDFIVFGEYNTKYTLQTMPEISGIPFDWKYECLFVGDLHRLTDTVCMMKTPKIGGGYYLDYNFPLTGNAKTLLAFLVEVLNADDNRVLLGDAEDTGTILVEFANWTVKQALDYISEQLVIDWYLENNTLHLKKKQATLATLFQTGNHGGLLNMRRLKVNKQLTTVVYAYGDAENLPLRTGASVVYDSSTLNENRLSFFGVDDESKVEKNVELYGRKTIVKEFPVKPEHTGTVTSLGIDLLSFFDKNFPFDVNAHIIPATVPKLVFLDGLLAGVEFIISYETATKKIELTPTTNGGSQIPNDVAHVQEGDSFVIFDIAYPLQYITEAQARLKQIAELYLEKYANPASGYEAVLDDRFIQKNNLTLLLGDIIRIVNSDMRVDAFFEIKELTRGIVESNKYSIKFGDIQPYNLLSKLAQQSFSMSNAINQIKQSTVTNTSILNITGDVVAWQDL